MGLGDFIVELVSQAVGKTAQGGAPQKPVEGEDASLKRERMVKSGAGLAIACVVIALFVLAATFLKAVAFGLILAYFLLPVERFYERLAKKGSWPFFLLRKGSGSTHEGLAFRASALTILSAGLAAAFALALAVFIAIPTVSGAGESVRKWASSNETFNKLELQLKSELGISSASRGAKDGDGSAKKGNLERFANWTTSRVGACLSPGNDGSSFSLENGESVAGSLVSVAKFVGGFLFDLLLTFFFLTYFLQKMAAFESSLGYESGRISPGSWLVKAIFDTKWMPKTSSESRGEAATVIDRVCQMLRAWVRGYLSIILLESVLYTGLFLLFKVPYAPLLGVLAGCTILIPFVGPLASGILTLSVCIVLGEDGLFTILGVISSYLAIHCVLEQLILYPRLVGETIGLSSLETVIVVLLGGLFGGVAGMIFAVPAASVIKFLIPTLYHCWLPRDEASQEAR